MKEYLKKFYKYLDREKELSAATVTNYAFYLDRFFFWSKSKGPKGITKDKVAAYTKWLHTSNADHDKLDQATINYHLIALRSLLTYFFEEGIDSLDPYEVRLKKLDIPDITPLSEKELTSLLEAPQKFSDDVMIQLRDTALLQALSSTGIKVSELSQLRRKDIDTDTKSIVVKKGSHTRALSTSKEALAALKKYLSKRRDTSALVFVRHDRARAGMKITALTPRSIQRTVKMYGQLAHIKQDVTPKLLRHSYAIHLIKDGVDLKQVQARLGHVASTTTQRYIG